jgi:hypothetical protein
MSQKAVHNNYIRRRDHKVTLKFRAGSPHNCCHAWLSYAADSRLGFDFRVVLSF